MHARFRNPTILLLFLLLAAGCTTVDETEWCVQTRYGNVINQHMDVGLNFTPISSATCFSMTEQAFPDPVAGEDDDETMEAQTGGDPVTVIGEVSIVWAYDPETVFDVFLAKRSSAAVEAEVRNAIRSGYRNAVAGWTIEDIFSNQRADLADSVQVHIQDQIGDLAQIRRVFVRDIKAPAAIEQARIQAARQQQVLAQAQQQLVIDSVEAQTVIVRERGASEARRLRAESYSAHPRLLDLEIAQTWAQGISEACRQAATCVLGSSLMDAWRPDS